MNSIYSTKAAATQTSARAQRSSPVASPEAAHPVQRLADASPQVASLMALQSLADGPVQCVSEAEAGRLAVTQRQAEKEHSLQEKPATTQRVAADDEELLQGKFPPAQCAAIDEEEPLQARFARVTGSPLPVLRRVDPTTEVNGVPVNDDPALEHEADVMGAKAAQFVAAPVALPQGRFGEPAQPQPQLNRTGLPDNLKAGVENLSGMSMDNVRVHYNSGKPAQLNALAYAQGTDIHLGPGQEKHLPHEAWHVVQQKEGGGVKTSQRVPVEYGKYFKENHYRENINNNIARKAFDDRQERWHPNSVVNGPDLTSAIKNMEYIPQNKDERISRKFANVPSIKCWKDKKTGNYYYNNNPSTTIAGYVKEFSRNIFTFLVTHYGA